MSAVDKYIEGYHLAMTRREDFAGYTKKQVKEELQDALVSFKNLICYLEGAVQGAALFDSGSDFIDTIIADYHAS